jgi:hypothetical protein
MDATFFDDPSQLAPPRTVRTELPGGGFVLSSPYAGPPKHPTRWRSPSATPMAAGGG